MLIKFIARSKALKKNASTVKTKATPLSSIRIAQIFLDTEAFDCGRTIDTARTYFESKGIKPVFLNAEKPEVNWYGKPEGLCLAKLECSEPAVFISLCPKNNFTLKYCAVASNAVFKLGRDQISPHVFDMLILGEDTDKDSVSGVFKFMTRLLEQIQ